MLKEKLESLDELILNEFFEPVTRYAHKKLGWTKYDLAAGCFLGANAAFLGSGIYQMMYGSTKENPLVMVTGSLCAILGLGVTAIVHKWKEINEKEELNLYAKTGTVQPPQLSAIRPLNFLVLSPSLTSIGVRIITEATEKSDDFQGLAFALWGIYEGMSCATGYFKNTAFIPPGGGGGGGEKKKLWRTIYEGIKSKIPSVKIPQPVEVVNQYTILEQKCQTEI